MNLFICGLMGVALLALPLATRPSRAAEPLMRVASGPPQSRPDAQKTDAKNGDDDAEPTQEQKFNSRFPQPVRVGHLIGLPVLDYDDSTIGYVTSVVRRTDGEIDLIVPYSAWFGWWRSGWDKRDVAVPIKTVAILARQIDALDFTREDFDAAPTWKAGQGTPLPADATTRIALGRR